MPDPEPLEITTVTVRTISANTVFKALADETRRQILAGLFDGQPHRAPGLGGSLPKHKDLVRKHIAALVQAGLVVREPDPQDNRRDVYRLAPGVKTATTPEGRAIDFGCCTMRC